MSSSNKPVEDPNESEVEDEEAGLAELMRSEGHIWAGSVEPELKQWNLDSKFEFEGDSVDMESRTVFSAPERKEDLTGQDFSEFARFPSVASSSDDNFRERSQVSSWEIIQAGHDAIGSSSSDEDQISPLERSSLLLTRIKKKHSLKRAFKIDERVLEDYFYMLLEHKVAQGFFLAYMERIDRPDDLQLLILCRAFRREPTLTNARIIFSNFLANGNDTVPVQVTSELFRAIIGKVVDHHLFEFCEEIIGDYMVREHFHRFLESWEFVGMIEVLDKNLVEHTEPIFEAISRRKIQDVLKYLGEGVRIDSLDENGETLLFAALRANAMDIAEELFIEPGGRDLVNFPNRDSMLPLHYAAYKGSTNQVKKLIAWGADPNLMCKQGNALHYAVLGNDARCVEVVLRAGVGCEVRNMLGETPIDIAKRKIQIVINEFRVGLLIRKSQIEHKFAQWSPSFSVSVDLFDKEHKQLIHYMNSLADIVHNKTSSGQIEVILTALEDYTKFHFTHEEKYMILYDYVGFRDHRSQHQKFESQIRVYVKNFTQRKTKNFEEKILAFLKNWVVNHILSCDMKYASLFADKEIGDE